MLSALGAREDDLVDVGERDVGIAVVQEGSGGDLLRRRRQGRLDVLLFEEAELLGHEGRIEQQRGGCRQRVHDLPAALRGLVAAARIVVVVATGRQGQDGDGNERQCNPIAFPEHLHPSVLQGNPHNFLPASVGCGSDATSCRASFLRARAARRRVRAASRPSCSQKTVVRSSHSITP
jgi:hypothetical protein